MDSFDGPPVDVPPANTSTPPDPDVRPGAPRGPAPDPPARVQPGVPGTDRLRRHHPPVALAHVRAAASRRPHHRHPLHPELHAGRLRPERPGHAPGARRPLRRRDRAAPDRERASREPGAARAHRGVRAGDDGAPRDGRPLDQGPARRCAACSGSRSRSSSERRSRPCCTPTTSPASWPSGSGSSGARPARWTWRCAGVSPAADRCGCT